MSRFVTGVLDDLQEDCFSSMIHDNINISRLMVHAEHVKKARDRRKINDAKMERSFDRGCSKNRLTIQDKPRFKKQVSSQVPSKFPKASGDRVSNPKFMKGKGTNSLTKKPTRKYGKKHYGDCPNGRIIV